jgi:PKD repeat protein
VAGISGAATNNGQGVASIGHNLTILPVKSTNSASFVTHGYDGVIYSVAAGADVINMSWGGGGSSTTAQNIISYAYNEGVVLVAAAGNDNVSSVFYPAGYPEVISVASTTFGDSKSSFSNYGSWIDISAPGSAIYSTVPGGGYQIKQGTSMASPMVAGLAGLMLSLNPSLSPADIETCILSTADDIDAANPSFIGQLGAGRINAFQAMNCVSATLDWAPEADFIASTVNILEGQTVDFTDLSIYNPTTWSWTFTGGTPATFNGQNPGPITYNTAGTYPVSLTVTNANGNDTETKTAYITVNALTGCDDITNIQTGDPNNVWTWGAPNGYIMGHNFLRYNRVAERFTAVGPTNLMGADFFFVEAAFVDPNTTIDIKVWADAAGSPGAELYSESIRISEIADNLTPTGFFPTVVDFDLPVAVPGANFFIGYEYAYRVGGGDTITCAASGDLTPIPTRSNSTWVFVNPGDNPQGIPTTGWQEVSDIGTIELAMHVYPRITSAPPIATINPTPATVCEGEFMTFDGSTSQNTVSWEWAINGTSTPFPTGSAPSVIMNEDGNHWVYMLAENFCGFFHIDSVEVTVNPTPSVSLTSSVASDSICPGGSANLVATGATSYVWTPGASLSCTTCPNPVASPTTNTTYTVTGTSGGCSSDNFYTLYVDNSAPDADFLISSDTICEGDMVSFNGALSDGGNSFTWTLTGATPGTASGSIVEVEYSTAGTYPVELTIENTCSQTDNATGQIVVLPAAACNTSSIDGSELNDVSLFYDFNNSLLTIDLNAIDGGGDVYITSLTGQVVYSENAAFGTTQVIDLKELSTGMYMVVLSTESFTKTLKFVR